MSPEEVAAFISEYGLSDMFLYANLLASNDPEAALNDNIPVPTFATVLNNATAAAEVAELDVAAIDAGVQTIHPQPAVQEEPLPTKTDLASGSKKSHKKRPRSAQLLAAEKKRKEKLNQIKKKKIKAEKLQKRKPIINVKKLKSDQSGESSNQKDTNEPKKVMLDIAGSGNGYNQNDYNGYMQLMSAQMGGIGTNYDQQINDFNQMAIPAPPTFFPFDQPNTNNLGLNNCNSNMFFDHAQAPYYPVMPPPDQVVDVIPEPMMMPPYMPLNQVPLALLNSLFPCSELLFSPPASPTPHPPTPPPQFPGDKSDV